MEVKIKNAVSTGVEERRGDTALGKSERLSKRLSGYRDYIRSGAHKRFRQETVPDVLAECEKLKLSAVRRSALLTRMMCEAENVVIEPFENIVFTRTLPEVPRFFSDEQWAGLFAGKSMHELGPISNICADWEMVLSQGLMKRRSVAMSAISKYADDAEKVELLESAIETLDAVLSLAARYAEKASELGRDDLTDILRRVPAEPPRTFREALQALRICHSVLWLSSHYHVGLGRFDQYMWPYLKSDLDSGRLTLASAGELLAEFFISLNKDSDLYPGIQQGDNGQSIMLGGVRRDGTDGVNLLTWMALNVGLELSLIDPKINLRVSKDTDLTLLKLAVEMTRRGLGFPQYSNDDVVIPALLAHGYEIEDARNYSVAACWEFLIPGKGMEVVNVGAVSMPKAVHKAIVQTLSEGGDFDMILHLTEADIREQVGGIVNEKRDLVLPPAPYYSALMSDLLEQGKDLASGAKYNNYGIHGACASGAADALAAVKKHVFDEKTISPQTLLAALEADFTGFEDVQCLLKDDSPKVGNNDDSADCFLVSLFDIFAEACEEVEDNGRGGSIRAGSGSAMYYVWMASLSDAVGATADGRNAGDYFGANLAPSLNVEVAGPVSVLKSFSKIDYNRIVNGGPITVEFSDSVFKTSDSIEKVAMFVKTFARFGCQQLQINTLNSRVLCDAQKNPERHRNLIVRVWGWSGYFCELSEEYQRQIISRAKYGI